MQRAAHISSPKVLFPGDFYKKRTGSNIIDVTNNSNDTISKKIIETIKTVSINQ